MKTTHLIDFSDSRQLTRLVWLTLAAVIIVVLAFGGYYYWDRYVFLGDESPIEQGVAELEQVVRENPQDPDARVALAQYYMQNGGYSEAVDQAKQVLQAYPENDSALFILGTSYIKSEQAEAAIEPLEQFVAIRQESSMANIDTILETALYYLGESFVQLEQPDKAIEALLDALEIDSTDADAMYQLGLAYIQNGQYEMAVDQFANAVRFVPDFTEAYQGMIVSYTSLSQPSYVAYARGMEAFSLQDYEVALTHLESTSTSLPGFAPAALGLGLTYEQLGDLEAAEASLMRALEADSNNFMANHALSRVQLSLQEKNK